MTEDDHALLLGAGSSAFNVCCVQKGSSVNSRQLCFGAGVGARFGRRMLQLGLPTARGGEFSGLESEPHLQFGRPTGRFRGIGLVAP